jgi:T5SS/PEP-CTERM-associated repeat protein
MNKKYSQGSSNRVAMLTLLAFASLAVQADNRYWSTTTCGSGTWDTDCWNGTSDTTAPDAAGAPVANDNIYLYNHTERDVTITYSSSISPSPYLSFLSINGYDTGSMRLNIKNGSSVLNRVGLIGDNGGRNNSVIVDGVGSSWNNSSMLIVNAGSLNINSGGSVVNTTGYLGYSFGYSAAAIIDGVGSSWSNNALIVGNAGAGSLNVTNGGLVSSEVGFLGYHSESSMSSGTVTINGTGSRWSNSDSLYVGGSSSSAGGSGVVNIQNGGQVDVANSLMVYGEGTVNLSGGSLGADTMDITSTGAQFNFTGGTLAVDTFNGNLVNEGGTLAPGHSTGLTTVNGNYSQDINSTLAIEIGGLIAGSEYDVLDVTGIASLAGILDIDLYDLGSGLFEPAHGDTFDIVTAESITGEFDFLSLVSLGNGLSWQVDYLVDAINTTDVVRLSVISAVPIPNAVWLFGSGLIGLTVFSRRTKAIKANKRGQCEPPPV